MCTCACGCVHPRWAEEDSIRCPVLSLSTLPLEIGSLTAPGTRLAANKPRPSSCFYISLQAGANMPDFHLGSRDLNSGPRVCTTNVLAHGAIQRTCWVLLDLILP